MGTAAGFSPGPLMYLVIQESMEYGFRAGLRVAFSPLVTDAFIISTVFFLLSVALAQDSFWQKTIPGLLYLCGGFYLLVLAWPSIQSFFSFKKNGKIKQKKTL